MHRRLAGRSSRATTSASPPPATRRSAMAATASPSTAAGVDDRRHGSRRAQRHLRKWRRGDRSSRRRPTGNVIQGNLIGCRRQRHDGARQRRHRDQPLQLGREQHHRRNGRRCGQHDRQQHRRRRAPATTAGIGNAILGNSIYSNTQNGIDLKDDGVTANDANDADSGANGLQNFPVLTLRRPTARTITLTGTFNSVASKTYRLEFFSNIGGGRERQRRGSDLSGFRQRDHRRQRQRDVQHHADRGGLCRCVHLGDRDRPDQQHLGVRRQCHGRGRTRWWWTPPTT